MDLEQLQQAVSVMQGQIASLVIHAHTGADSLQIQYGNLLGAASGIAARMYANGSTNGIATSTDTKINIGASDFAVGITADTANNRMKILTAGKYLISAAAYWTAPTANKLYKSLIYVNSNQKSMVQAHTSSTSGISPVVADILSLAVGDIVELYAFQNSGGADNVSSSQNATWLSATKVA